MDIIIKGTKENLRTLYEELEKRGVEASFDIDIDHTYLCIWTLINKMGLYNVDSMIERDYEESKTLNANLPSHRTHILREAEKWNNKNNK